MRTIEELERQQALIKAELAVAKGSWPSPGDTYWMRDEKRAKEYEWNATDWELHLKSLGLIFPSKAACELDFDRRVATATLREEISKANRKEVWSPQWDSLSQSKWYPFYDYEERALKVTSTISKVWVPADLYSTESVWREMVKVHRVEVLLFLNVTPPKTIT